MRYYVEATKKRAAVGWPAESCLALKCLARELRPINRAFGCQVAGSSPVDGASLCNAGASAPRGLPRNCTFCNKPAAICCYSNPSSRARVTARVRLCTPSLP